MKKLVLSLLILIVFTSPGYSSKGFWEFIGLTDSKPAQVTTPVTPLIPIFPVAPLTKVTPVTKVNDGNYIIGSKVGDYPLAPQVQEFQPVKKVVKPVVVEKNINNSIKKNVNKKINKKVIAKRVVSPVSHNWYWCPTYYPVYYYYPTYRYYNYTYPFCVEFIGNILFTFESCLFD